MKITILTLFKEMFDSLINTSIIKRTIDKGLVEVEVVNFREYSTDRLKRVDDAPYGGGAGMIIKLQPILDCLNAVKTKNSVVYLLSAKGKVYNQQTAHELAKKDHVILICGHYEGVDDRILDYIDGEICIGDYILTGGELAAMIVSDSIIRLLDGAIKEESTSEESFENGLLEYPQYTKPREFRGREVPEILLSGDHAKIDRWRLEEAVKITKERRPDMLALHPEIEESLKPKKKRRVKNG